MSEQNRYRGSAQRGPNRAGESQWQRDYGQRNQRTEQRFDSAGRASNPRTESSVVGQQTNLHLIGIFLRKHAG